MKKVSIGLMLTAGIASDFKSTIGGAQKQFNQLGDALSEVKLKKNAFKAFETAEDQLKDSLKQLNKVKKSLSGLKTEQDKYTQSINQHQSVLNRRNQQLEQTQQTIKSVRAALKKDAGNVALTRKLSTLILKQKLLKKTITQTKSAYQQAKKDNKSLERAVTSLSQQEKRLAKNVDKKRGAFKRASRTIHDAGYDVKNYRQQIGKLNPEIEKLTRKQIKLGNVMKKQRLAREKADAARMKVVDAYVMGSGMASVLTGMGESESAVADIAITADLNDEQIKEVRKKIGDAADDAFQTVKKTTIGMGALLTAGMDYNDAKDMIAPVAKTSTAANAEVEEVSKTVFALNSNLKVTTGEMQKAMDMLVIGGKAGAFELKDMAQYFPMLTADAQKLGLKGTNAVATLGSALQIAKRGAGDPAEAANNMKNYLAKLTAPETIKLFKKRFKVDLEKEMKGAVKKGIDPLEHSLELIQKLTGGDAFRIGEVFGDMQAKSFITPLLQDYEDYKKIKKQMQEGGGAVQSDLDRRAELDPTLQWTRLGESLKSLRDTSLLPLIKPMTQLVIKLTEFIKPIKGIVDSHPELVKWGGMLVGTLVAGKVAGSALGYVFHFMKGSIFSAISIFGKFSRVALLIGRVAFPVLATGLRAMGMALVANPIGALIMVIATGAALIIANWGTIGPKIKASLGMAWEGIKAQFGAMLTALKEKPLQTLATLPMAMVRIGFEVINGFAKGLFDFDLKAKIVSIGDNIKNWFKEKLGIHSPSVVFSSFGGDVMQGFILGLKNKLKSVQAAIAGIGDKVTGWFKSKLGINSPSTVFMGFGDNINEGLAIGLQKSIEKPVGKIQALRDKLGKALNKEKLAVPLLNQSANSEMGSDEQTQTEGATGNSNTTVNTHIDKSVNFNIKSININLGGKGGLLGGKIIKQLGLPTLINRLKKLALIIGRNPLGSLITGFRALALVIAANPIGAIITVIATGAALIIANWGTIGPKIKASLGMAWEGIKAQFGAMLTALKEKPLQTLATLPMAMVRIGFEVINGFAKGLFDFDLKAKIVSIGDNIKNWFKEKLGIHSPSVVFSGFGGDVMQGFILGLKSKLKSVQAAIAGIGDKVTGWFKSKLGINSPSTVFMGFGDNINEGLAIGLQNSTDKPLGKITALNKKIAGVTMTSAALTMPMSAAAQHIDWTKQHQPASATHQTKPAQTIDARLIVENITIHPSPDMDAKAIGEEVRRQLEAFQRQQQTRYHSALYDGDDL